MHIWINVKGIAWNDQQIELADAGRRWGCYLWQSSWNMVCGRNEKFNVFDLACGLWPFLNNSLKALALTLPTTGDYELLRSVIPELCTGPANAWTSARAACSNNALWHFPVIVFFFSHSSFWNQCSKGEDPLDIQSGVSTKVFHVVPIVQDLLAAGVINYPKNTDLVTLKWCYPAHFAIFMPIPRCNTPPWRILDLLPLWALLQPFSPALLPAAFDCFPLSALMKSFYYFIYSISLDFDQFSGYIFFSPMTGCYKSIFDMANWCV